MLMRARDLAAMAAAVATTVIVVACSEPGSAPAAATLSPKDRPSLGLALPTGCTQSGTGKVGGCGIATTPTPEVERLKVCKSYPAKNGPDVILDITATTVGNPTSSITAFRDTLHYTPGSDVTCLMYWSNGELRGPNADVLQVQEIVPAGYTATSQVITINKTPSTTTGPVTSATLISGLVIGGPGGPGAVVMFTNTPTPPATYSIGDRVWNDVNGDGVQDAGENGLPGVVVTVTDASHAVVGSTTTSATGMYTVGNLVAGTYTVCVANTPAGYTPTFDLDGVATPGCTSVVVSADRTDVDFGYTPPRYSIGDRVWNDGNANGLQDAGEPGMPGVTVTVTDASHAVVGTATTDASGMYTVSNLLAGTYTACVSGVPSGFNPSADLDGVATPGCATFSVTASRTDVDFGYYQLGSLGDFVWNDLNANGIQDAGEPGIPGVTVKLTKGATTLTTTTDASGKYAFSALVAGTYTVTVSGTPIGFVPSPTDAGANDALDSDGSGVSVVVAGAPNTTVDFGFHEQIGTVACTYTQGFWKNHEESWPTPFSPNAPWMTAQKQVTGLTWDGLFGLAPKGGNSYVQLAHQWMAAKLNRAQGAPTSAAVLQALNAAEAWLLANTPTNGALPSIKNAQADAWGTTLDNFNNGLAGTPHCD